MVEIIQKGNKVLRLVAKDVPIDEIGSKRIDGVIEDMKKALDKEEDGVAIAAPQINESLRIFVISHKILKKENEDYDMEKSMVFINPKIIKTSKEKESLEEGCLSVRWWYGHVPRSKLAKVRAYNEKGERFEMGASGLLAQIFQHETDHLDGILFTDKAEDLEEIPPKEEN